MKRLIATLLLTFALIAPASTFAADSTADKAFVEQSRKAVALLYSQDESGGMKMHCTATAYKKVEKGYLFVTAAHCVGGDDKGGSKERSANPFKQPFYVTKDEVGEKRFWKATPKWVGFQSRGEDFSVFSVETEENWPVVEIGDESVLKDGAEYWNLASPLGLGIQTFTGAISSMKLERPLTEGDINWAGALVLQQAGVNGGSSGSALISKETHKIVGFLVGTIAQSSIIGIPVSRFVAVEKAVAEGKYQWWQVQQEVNPDGTPKDK